MLIRRKVVWNEEDIGPVTMFSIVGDPQDKRWGLAVSNVLVAAFNQQTDAETARKVLIKNSQVLKIFLLTGLGPHVINLLPIGEK